MSRPRTTNAEPRTKNPTFPLRIDPLDPHRILDSKWTKDADGEPRLGRLVDIKVRAEDAAFIVRESNKLWEAREKVRLEKERLRQLELEEAARIPEATPNVAQGGAS